MFTIILKDLARRELERVARQGNERFLLRSEPSFRLLSQISTSSYDVLSGEDAHELLGELDTIRTQLDDDADRKHVDAIRALAIKCKSTEGTVLVITPFES